MNKSKRVVITGAVVSILMLLLNMYPLTKTTALTCYEGANTYSVEQRQAGFPFTFYISHYGNKCLNNDDVHTITTDPPYDGVSFSVSTFGFDLVLASGVVLIAIMVVERMRSKK